MSDGGGRAGRKVSRPPTAQEAVLRELRRAIEAGDLRPGERVRQDEIAGRLGVSRVPVREALKVLQAERLVEHRPHRGYAVRELSPSELHELCLMRALLEGEAIRQAVPNLDDSAIDELDRLAGELERAGEAASLGAYVALNREFYQRLFRGAGLPLLCHNIEMLWQASEPYGSSFFSDPDARRQADSARQGVLEALRQRDADRVVHLVDRQREAHLRLAQQF